MTRFEKNSPTPPVTSKVFELETPAGRCEVGARDVFEAKTLAAEAAGCTYDDVQLVSITEEEATQGGDDEATALRARLAEIVTLNPHGYERLQSYRVARKRLTALQPDTKEWPRGRCEHWMTPRSMCGEPGRWLVGGQIRCAKHGLRTPTSKES